jgi:hypothetical protein
LFIFLWFCLLWHRLRSCKRRWEVCNRCSIITKKSHWQC